MTITLRTTKGSALSQSELDGNFTDLDGRATTATTGIASATSTANSASTAAATASTAATAASTAAGVVATNLAAHAGSTSAHGIPALQTAIAAATLTPITFTLAVPFNALVDLGIQTVTSVLAFTVNTTGAVRNGYAQVTIVADGTHVPTLTGFLAYGTDAGYVNTNGVIAGALKAVPQ